jgi:hypothetical protein
MHRHQHQHRRRRPRIPSTLPNNVKEHLPPSEGAGLISSRPNPVNKLFAPPEPLSALASRDRQKRTLRVAAFAVGSIMKKPPGAAGDKI